MQLVELSKTESFKSFGSRSRALTIRDHIESIIKEHGSVTVDFSDIYPTQSFVDELVGVLILEHGPSILEKLSFANCSEQVQTILHFVASDRISQYQKNRLSA